MFPRHSNVRDEEKKKGETGSGVSLRGVCVRENGHENCTRLYRIGARNHIILTRKEKKIKEKRERKFMLLANNKRNILRQTSEAVKRCIKYQVDSKRARKIIIP